ncbi:MAG: hypothetical protein KDB88_08045 [Flavobacteriales bacterium]|nr:hypothetical protein [Flavobacteriales bacterium]
MRLRSILTILAVVLFGRPQAQDISALRRSVDWSEVPVPKQVFAELSPDGRTEVMRDELSVRMRNIKPEFFTLFFERMRVIHFGNETDVARHSRFVIPESLDPPMDGQYLPHEERALRNGALWYNVRPDHFGARVVRPDGTWNELSFLIEVLRDTIRTLMTNEVAWSYALDISPVQPGDVVQVWWKYMVPYDASTPYARGWRGPLWTDNWSRLTSWRIFFHDEIPIREQRIEVKYDLRQGVSFSGMPPLHQEVNDNEAMVSWERAFLPGCMDEVNARPGSDLEHIVIRIDLDDPRYWRREWLSGVGLQYPYWNLVLRRREANALWWKRVARKNVPDNQNQLFKAFLARIAGATRDVSSPLRVARVHDHIAAHFEVDMDDAWYNDEDLRLQRIGDQVTEGRIGFRSRYDMYAKLIDHYFLNYHTAYLLDSRVGEFTDHFLTPLWENEFLFGILFQDGTLWMHPKRTRNGWFVNELPFYYEGTRAFITDVSDLWFAEPLAASFVDLHDLPNEQDRRYASSQVTVDLATGSVHVEAEIRLRGQFSTLCRGTYLYDERDSTVMPVYGHRLDRIEGATNIRLDPGSPSNKFPFPLTVKVSMDLEGRLLDEGEGTFALDLSGLLHHAVPKGFVALGRDLPFHWDFIQQDLQHIDVRFSAPVSLLPGDSVYEEHRSGSASYAFEILQAGGTDVSIASDLNILAAVERGPDYQALEDLLQAVHRSARSCLRVRKQGDIRP